MKNLKQIRFHLERAKGKKTQLEKDFRETVNTIRTTKKSLILHEKAREVVTEVGLKTQEQLQIYISDITSLALESIFDDPYTLQVEFVQRRNKTECDIYFTRNGKVIDPLEGSGGGAVDVASFALRIASWSMQQPKTRPVIVLDEPMRFLSEDKQSRASEMIKQLSNKLGIQFIIVTHETALTTMADKIFKTSIRNKVTNIQTNDV